MRTLLALVVCLSAARVFADGGLSPDGDVTVDAGRTVSVSAFTTDRLVKYGRGTLETSGDFSGKAALDAGTWRICGGSSVVVNGSPVNETSWFYVKGEKGAKDNPAAGAFLEVTEGASLTIKGVNYVGVGDRYIGNANCTQGYGAIIVRDGSYLDLSPNSQVRMTDYGSVGGVAVLAVSNATAVIRKELRLAPTDRTDNVAQLIVSGSTVSNSSIIANGPVATNGAWFDGATLVPLAASEAWLTTADGKEDPYYHILPGGLTVEANVDVTIPAALTGPGGFVKTGRGTVTLSAANDYAGGTVVREGTLVVKGAVTGRVTMAGGCLTLMPGCWIGTVIGEGDDLQVSVSGLERLTAGTVVLRSDDADFLTRVRRVLLPRVASDLDLAVSDDALTLVASSAGDDAVGGVVGRVPFADGKACWQNPGCGRAGGGWSTLEKGAYVNVTLSSPNQTKLWSLQKFSKGYLYNNNQTHYEKAMHYCGGADIPLDSYALKSIADAFASCRAAGGTVIPRFAYTWDGFGGCEPDDFEMILTHIRQLAALCAEYRDIIPAVECGTIGAYGEMHTSRYCDREHARRITSVWLDNLPDDMAFLVRSPCYVLYEAGAATTSEFFGRGMDALPRIRRIGFYNDGYLGTDGDYGTWGSGGTSFTRDQGRAYLRSRGNVPYGGEFATVTDAYFDQNVHLLDPSRFNIVAEWYDTHLSYLRTIRSTNMTIYQRLVETPFDSATWAFDNMPYLEEYDGETLQKFCEDHMGYRYVVRGVEARRQGRRVTFRLKVENTGFGRLCFPETKEILLAESGGSVCAVVPATGTDLRLLEGGRMTAVEVAFELPETLPLGRYEVSLRERVPLADEDGSGLPRRAIAFANEGAYDAATKANFLGVVRIDGSEDPAVTENLSSGGTVWTVAGTTRDMRAVVFTPNSRLVVAGGGTVQLGESVPEAIEVVNGRLVFDSFPVGFDFENLTAHGNEVVVQNSESASVAIDLTDRTYDGMELSGNFRYVVRQGMTCVLDAPRWIADFDVDVYGTLDVRADLVLGGDIDVIVHEGGTMGNLCRNATSGAGMMTVRDRAKIVVEKGGLLLNPVNGNWTGSGLELMTDVDGATSLVLDGGTVAVHRMSGTGKGKIEVRSDSVWQVWYGGWYGDHRPQSPFKGAAEVRLDEGATLTLTRIRQTFGDNQQDGGDITVRLADVHITGSGDLVFGNEHPSRKVTWEIVSMNDCTGTVSLTEDVGAALVFLSGSSWGGDIALVPGVLVPDDWWFAASAPGEVAYGGVWEGADAFAVTNSASAKRDAVISFGGVAGWVAEFPENPGIASFLFRLEDEALRPYGYTAEGWVALGGRAFTEKTTFEGEISFRRANGVWTVGYTVDGAELRDALGRTRFPADYDPSVLRRIVFGGEGKHGDFRGRLVRRQTGFVLQVR